MPSGARRLCFFIAVSLAITIALLLFSRLSLSMGGGDLSSQPAEIKPIKEELEDPVWDTQRLDISKFLNKNLTIGRRVAVLIETRPLHNLVPLMLHFSNVLGPGWPIVLFTPLTALPNSAPLLRALKKDRIQVQSLPPKSKNFASHQALSVFLTQPWFWEQLAPAERVLMFQTDSIICSNAPQTMDDFLDWDFVGAPILEGWGVGYNGGLSLRNRNMVLDIIAESSFKDELDAAKKVLAAGEELAFHIEYEDQWLFKKMTELPEKKDGDPGAKLPVQDVAKTFAVETVFYERPLGYHQISKFQPQFLDQVGKWCPEYKLASTDVLPVNHEE